MRHHRIALITAAALIAAPFAPVPAHAMDALPARAVRPADVPAPAVVKRINTDMDGDGVRDQVNLTYLGSDNFELAVTTTRGRTSKVAFTSHVDPSFVPAAATFYGADAIDGRKGSELIVHRYAADITPSGQNLTVAVYTWRSGELVAEAAPAARTGTGWEVGVTEGSETASGYGFFTSHGRRYVDTSRLTMTGGRWRYEGSVTRSVWRGGRWVEISTRSARATSLTWKQVGMAGPKLLRGQVKVDVSGDGRADLVLFHQLGLQHYRATVHAHGRSASADVTNGEFPFVGAAAVDGVAGNELIANTAGRTPWTVLTWRHSGKLVKLGARALFGEAGSSRPWHRAAVGAFTNFPASMEAGRHVIVPAWGVSTADPGVQPVHFAKSVWQQGHWTKLTEWTAELTGEQRAVLTDGITVPDLVTP